MARPRYPAIRVSLRSDNALALVAAVRHALRKAGVDQDEIQRFSAEALSHSEPDLRRQTCRDWAFVEVID